MEILKSKKDLPHFPEELAHVWDWFTRIFNPSGIGMGPYRVSFREIEAYSRVTGELILGSEAILIRSLSEKYMIVDSKKRPSEGSANSPKIKPVSLTDSNKLLALFGRAGKTKPKSKPD